MFSILDCPLLNVRGLYIRAFGDAAITKDLDTPLLAIILTRYFNILWLIYYYFIGLLLTLYYFTSYLSYIY
jgi:hypothetical protein